MSEEHAVHRAAPGWGTSRRIFPGFAAIAGFLVVTEQPAHVLGALPWRLLARCPLMHFRRGEHGSPAKGDRQEAKR